VEQFHVLLRQARRSVGITQRDLARLAHVSRSSLLAYELQRRHPTRDTLCRVLDSLGIDLHRRNELLAAAGYAIEDSVAIVRSNPLDFEAACADVEARPWVSFLLNELIEIRAASQLGRALWPINKKMLEEPARRSMLSILTKPWYADGIADWDEAARFHIGLFKARLAPGSTDSPDAYVTAVLEEVERGRAALVTRFFECWESTPPNARESSTSWYETAWTHRGVRLRFWTLNNIINDRDALYTSDWLPADDVAYQAVMALKGDGHVGRKNDQRRRRTR